MTLAIGILAILCGVHAIRLAIRSLRSAKLEADDVVLDITKRTKPVKFCVGVVSGIVVGIALILFGAFLVVFSIMRQPGK